MTKKLIAIFFLALLIIILLLILIMFDINPWKLGPSADDTNQPKDVEVITDNPQEQETINSYTVLETAKLIVDKLQATELAKQLQGKYETFGVALDHPLNGYVSLLAGKDKNFNCGKAIMTESIISDNFTHEAITYRNLLKYLINIKDSKQANDHPYLETELRDLAIELNFFDQVTLENDQQLATLDLNQPVSQLNVHLIINNALADMILDDLCQLPKQPKTATAAKQPVVPNKEATKPVNQVKSKQPEVTYVEKTVEIEFQFPNRITVMNPGQLNAIEQTIIYESFKELNQHLWKYLTSVTVNQDGSISVAINSGQTREFVASRFVVPLKQSYMRPYSQYENRLHVPIVLPNYQLPVKNGLQLSASEKTILAALIDNLNDFPPYTQISVGLEGTVTILYVDGSYQMIDGAYLVTPMYWFLLP